MSQPESLPAKMFLLAFDLRRNRLTARDELGYLVRAAALADLVLNGRLRDEGGKVMATGPVSAADPVFDDLWSAIEADPGRSWRRWIERGRRETFAAVRGQLAAGHVISAEPARFLGLFPYTRVTLRDTRAARRVAEQVSRAIRGGQAASRVDSDAGVLAALAAAGQLRVVAGIRDRRQFKSRLDTFGEPVEPIVKALRRAINSKRAAAASSG